MKWLFNLFDCIGEERIWKITFALHIIWIIDVIVLAIAFLRGWRP